LGSGNAGDAGSANSGSAYGGSACGANSGNGGNAFTGMFHRASSAPPARPSADIQALAVRLTAAMSTAHRVAVFSMSTLLTLGPTMLAMAARQIRAMLLEAVLDVDCGLWQRISYNIADALYDMESEKDAEDTSCDIMVRTRGYNKEGNTPRNRTKGSPLTLLPSSSLEPTYIAQTQLHASGRREPPS
jgi:hypothetical protein